MLFWKTVLVWNEDVSSHRDSIPQPLAWFVSLKSRFFWVLKIASFFALGYYFHNHNSSVWFKVLKVVSLIFTTISLLIKFLIVVCFFMISESTQNCSNFPIPELDSSRNSPKNFVMIFSFHRIFLPNSFFQEIRIFQWFHPSIQLKWISSCPLHLSPQCLSPIPRCPTRTPPTHSIPLPRICLHLAALRPRARSRMQLLLLAGRVTWQSWAKTSRFSPNWKGNNPEKSWGWKWKF